MQAKRQRHTSDSNELESIETYPPRIPSTKTTTKIHHRYSTRDTNEEPFFTEITALSKQQEKKIKMVVTKNNGKNTNVCHTHYTHS